MELEEYLKRNEKYITLEFNLEDIKAYINDTLEYLNSNHKENYDVEEIKMYLSCIPEILDEITTIIVELIDSENS